MEKDIEKYFVKCIDRIGGRAYKFVSPSHAGVYDRIVVLPGGKVWFVEIKQPNGRMSKLQEKFRDDVMALGARNAVLYSRDAVDTFINMVETEK